MLAEAVRAWPKAKGVLEAPIEDPAKPVPEEISDCRL
jgi:hypothetical protein